jgi:endoglucanase
VNWGTAAYPHKIETMIGMWLMSGDVSHLRFMTHSADFSLGANPLNLSWTTGLGDNPVYGPAHLFGWNTFLGIMPPGLQVEGPNQDHDYIKRFMNENTPPPEETPHYYNYYDIRYSIGLNEGVVGNQAWTAFLYGALLPDLE